VFTAHIHYIYVIYLPNSTHIFDTFCI